ncbi:MAG: hypothetical protein ACRD1T_17440, partial [Acidimicrobiia bacterium]
MQLRRTVLALCLIGGATIGAHPAAAVPAPIEGVAVATIAAPDGSALIVTALARGVIDSTKTMVLALECNAVSVGVAAATEIKQCYVETTLGERAEAFDSRLPLNATASARVTKSLRLAPYDACVVGVAFWGGLNPPPPTESGVVCD